MGKIEISHQILHSQVGLFSSFFLKYPFLHLLRWTNRSKQDTAWVEFSTLKVTACITMHLFCYEAKLSNLKLKVRLQQLWGSLSLNIMHIFLSYFHFAKKQWQMKLISMHLIQNETGVASKFCKLAFQFWDENNVGASRGLKVLSTIMKYFFCQQQKPYSLT
jgi:hypothetical protein